MFSVADDIDRGPKILRYEGPLDTLTAVLFDASCFEPNASS